MGKYYEQAVACVKDYVLPAQRKLYEKCGSNFFWTGKSVLGDRSK